MNEKETEVIIHEEYSTAWKNKMPVTMITYPDGGVDIHCQTGDHHRKAIDVAKKIMKEKGYEVLGPVFEGPTGWYYKCTKI